MQLTVPAVSRFSFGGKIIEQERIGGKIYLFSDGSPVDASPDLQASVDKQYHRENMIRMLAYFGWPLAPAVTEIYSDETLAKVLEIVTADPAVSKELRQQKAMNDRVNEILASDSNQTP